MGYDLKYGRVTVEHGDKIHGSDNDGKAVPLNESDEPVMVFRAQDKLTVPLLARYENLYVATQPDNFDADTDPFVIGLRTAREEFQKWQQANPDKVKLPD